MIIKPVYTIAAIAIVTVLSGTLADDKPATEAKKTVDKKKTADKKEAADKQWKPLFNGRNLEGWEITEFGGEGEVEVVKEEVIIHQGVDLSGIRTTRKDIPRSNYEIEFEAMRAEGNDFFVGLTFPVRKDPCTFIMGGWGGGVCGLSSLDGMDASENDTTTYEGFVTGKWYKIRLRVTDDKIDVWVVTDGKEAHMVDVETKYYKFSIRYEVEGSKPLGFATYQTTAHIRNARIRTLNPEERKGSPKTSK